MIELTAEQRLQLNTDVPRVIDPETRTRYVLVKEDVYERLEALLVPGRLSLSEQQAALHAAGLRPRAAVGQLRQRLQLRLFGQHFLAVRFSADGQRDRPAPSLRAAVFERIQG